MVIQAWYPLGHGDKALLEEPLFAELAKKYGKTNAQVILRSAYPGGEYCDSRLQEPGSHQGQFRPVRLLTDGGGMAKITALDKDTRYYTSTPEMLRRYVEMVPDVDGQK